MTANIRFHSSFDNSKNGTRLFIPALFTRISIFPNRSIHNRESASAVSGKPTSPALYAYRTPRVRTSVFNDSSFASSVPLIIRSAPFSANANAISLPIPRLAPVTIADFPCSITRSPKPIYHYICAFSAFLLRIKQIPTNTAPIAIPMISVINSGAISITALANRSTRSTLLSGTIK